MENVDRTALRRWVEESAALLAPPADWEPDATAARARLEGRLRRRSGISRYWLVGAAMTSLGGAVLLVSPTARAHAVWCLNCVAGVLAPAAQAPAAVAPAGQRKPAPDFARTELHGSAIRLAEYRGKVVVLNFWATWCPPCKIEIPWLMAFQSRYEDHGLAVIGVSMDGGGWGLAKPFAVQRKINYPVVIGGEDLAKLHGVESLPMTVLIDRDGNIAAVHSGLLDRNTLEGEIRRLLGIG
jgi:thiol-disulfide isomerase/thioredoxin